MAKVLEFPVERQDREDLAILGMGPDWANQDLSNQVLARKGAILKLDKARVPMGVVAPS